MSVFQPAANACPVVMGAQGNSAYIGLVYAPAAYAGVASPYTFEAAGTGGVIADSFGFGGTMPRITYSSSYAPVPPASRLTS